MKRLIVLLCVVGLAVAGPPFVKTKEEIEELRQALEKTRTDDGVLLETRMKANPEGNVWENSGKYQGDILLDDTQVEELVSDYATGGADNRNAFVVANTRWPGNIMIYAFGVNEFDAAQQNAILVAMSWIEHFSCVRFRRRTSERIFVNMLGRGTGCYAHVGYSTIHTNRVLNLARNRVGVGCFHQIVIIHELLHSIGFQHMHQTFERNNFVRINWNNIQQGYAFAFDQFPRNQVNLLGTPYEYTSMMHYSTHAFSRNRQPTITALRSFSGTMGQIQRVTDMDWLRLRRHYNCPGAWSAGALERIKEEVERTLPLMNMNLPPPNKHLDDIDIDNINVDEAIVNEEYDGQDIVNDDAIANEEDTADGINIVDGE